MREMKDSGIEWIGAMPRAWKMNTIADYDREYIQNLVEAISRFAG